MSKLETLSWARARALGLLGLLAFLAPLLTRLVIGQAFYLTGGGKIENLDNVVSFFTELGIPWPEANALFISRLEYWGGLLLAVGLGTRLVAAGLASTMVVALLTAERQNFLDALHRTGESGLTDVVPFVYLLFLVWVILAGPGALSLDALLVRLLERRAPPVEAKAAALEPAA